MTIHAGPGRWNSCKVRFLYGGVAVATVNSNPTDVMGMAELDRLFAHDFRLRDVRGAIDFSAYPGQTADDEKEAKNGEFRDSIRAAVEDLRHCLSRRWNKIELYRIS